MIQNASHVMKSARLSCTSTYSNECLQCTRDKTVPGKFSKQHALWTSIYQNAYKFKLNYVKLNKCTCSLLMSPQLCIICVQKKWWSTCMVKRDMSLIYYKIYIIYDCFLTNRFISTCLCSMHALVWIHCNSCNWGNSNEAWLLVLRTSKQSIQYVLFPQMRNVQGTKYWHQRFWTQSSYRQTNCANFLLVQDCISSWFL